MSTARAVSQLRGLTTVSTLLLLLACASPAAPLRAEAAEELEKSNELGDAPAPAEAVEVAPPAEAAPAAVAPHPPFPQTPGVGLDSLLKLPSDRVYTVERRGGLTSGEWKTRFTDAQAAIEAEHKALLEAEAKLEITADSNAPWQFAPPLPGQDQADNASDNPVDFKLRQAIRRHREEIERLERRLREVEIEANLAGVPEEWRSAPSPPPADDGVLPHPDQPFDRAEPLPEAP